MCEKRIKEVNMESPVLPAKPISHFSSVAWPNSPTIQYDRRTDRSYSSYGVCFRCHQPGHWSRDCPLNNKSSSISNIYCRCGHGLCEIRTTKTHKSYYVCPIKRGKKCIKVKWPDEVEEIDFCPPQYKYPTCSCGAGVCRRVKATSGPNKGHYFFACPIRKGHGACSYLVWEDTLRHIPCIEDLHNVDMDLDITPNFGDVQDMDMDQGTDFPDVDDSQDIDESISSKWEFLEENARSRLRLSKPSTTCGVPPNEQIQHHEEEKVSLDNIHYSYIEQEECCAKALFGASQHHSQQIQEEPSQLKIKDETTLEAEIISCELLIMEMESGLGEIEESMVEG